MQCVNVLFQLPTELQIHIFSLMDIKTLFLSMSICRYMNNLHDFLIGFNYNIAIIDEKYLIEKRKFCIKYLEKCNKIEELFKVLYDRMEKDKIQVRDIILDFYYGNTHNRERSEYKKNEPEVEFLDYGIKEIERKILSHVDILFDHESKLKVNTLLQNRITMLENYKKYFQADMQKFFKIKIYLQMLLEIFFIPENGFRTFYGLLKKTKIFNLSMNKICDTCDKIIKKYKGELYIDIEFLLDLFRLYNYKYFEIYGISYIYDEYMKLNPTKKINMIDIDGVSKHHYKVSDLCSLLMIMSKTAIKSVN